MKKELRGRFLLSVVLFSLVGQVAWVVENMYFNVFIYKMFYATPGQISLMVSASAVTATLTTWIMGAFSDKVGRRKVFISLGYIIWGISILSFSLVRLDILTPIAGSFTAACTLGVTLVIILDCLMTFFGSGANDACFNAWLTDMGSPGIRGAIEGINSMMPLVAVLVVFGGFMAFDLNKSESWVLIYTIIGGVVILMGLLGLFFIEEPKNLNKSKETYGTLLLYSFRPAVIKNNLLLYLIVIAFAVFGISIQTFMPYLILYYDVSLGLTNYVLIMAPAIMLAAIITAFYGRLYDMLGFNKSVVPTVIMLLIGYTLLFFGRAVPPVFIGSLFMMSGYLCGMAVFGAMIRDNIPKGQSGLFQGLRIFGQVFIPGVLGPMLGAFVLRNADVVVGDDGTNSFIPNENIFLGAAVVAFILLILLFLVFRFVRTSHYDLRTEGGEPDWSSYPRPSMERASYQSLNGTWNLNGKPIIVPFPPEAPLSGYKGKVGSRLCYEREFTPDESLLYHEGKRVILNFGAVDQVCDVFVNEILVCHNEGGYLPFSADITDTLKDVGNNKLTVKAFDNLSHFYPYGKQRKRRGGMWYTPVSGIWQSVWLEAVPKSYIAGIKVSTRGSVVSINPETKGPDSGCLFLDLELREGIKTLEFNSGPIKFDLSDFENEPIKWCPDNPHLYSFTLRYGEDEIKSYFALRDVSLEEVEGVKKLCINGKPFFIKGVLDQGYFPDGLFLPPSPKCYERDILAMKELGINLLRKHVKVEPEIYYYLCDKLGMPVMQDMVNSGHYSFIFHTALPTLGLLKVDDKKIPRNKKRAAFFIEHSKNTIRHLYNHPGVIAYTVFNEAWGQFDSDSVGGELKSLDPSRLYNYTSGWFAGQESDFLARHLYFDRTPLKSGEKALIITECGGFSRNVGNHRFSKYASYGYGGETDGEEELIKNIEGLLNDLIIPSKAYGLCGFIYTQLSDVEDEVNGLLTYDRKVIKVNKTRFRELMDGLS